MAVCLCTYLFTWDFYRYWLTSSLPYMCKMFKNEKYCIIFRYLIMIRRIFDKIMNWWIGNKIISLYLYSNIMGFQLLLISLSSSHHLPLFKVREEKRCRCFIFGLKSPAITHFDLHEIVIETNEWRLQSNTGGGKERQIERAQKTLLNYFMEMRVRRHMLCIRDANNQKIKVVMYDFADD